MTDGIYYYSFYFLVRSPNTSAPLKVSNEFALEQFEEFNEFSGTHETVRVAKLSLNSPIYSKFAKETFEVEPSSLERALFVAKKAGGSS
mmetsp:Transcript_21367/g.33058  ORF Transcript_21367/g.33058 Transcript_21367/m.33058 type:complete len:89 (+) Transcript_21367:6065-6331(+)